MMFDHLKAFMKKTYIFSLSCLTSFLFLCRWKQLTRRTTTTRITTRAPAEAPIRISNCVLMGESSRSLDFSEKRENDGNHKGAAGLHKASKETQKAYSILRLKCHAPTWYFHHIFCFSNSQVVLDHTFIQPTVIQAKRTPINELFSNHRSPIWQSSTIPEWSQVSPGKLRG